MMQNIIKNVILCLLRTVDRMSTRFVLFLHAANETAFGYDKEIICVQPNCLFTIELQFKDSVLSQRLMAEDQIAEYAIIQNTEVLSDKKKAKTMSATCSKKNTSYVTIILSFAAQSFYTDVYQFRICLYQLTLFCRLTTLFRILICSTMKNGL